MDMLKCYIVGKNLVDGSPEHFRIATGAVFSDNYNETLDSATIVLPQLDHKIDIEPYDVVVIYSTDDSKVKIIQRAMCVDTLRCTQTSLGPAIFKYEISLFSETKSLEGMLCPSLSITKLVDSPRTVAEYLYNYGELYEEKIKINGNYQQKFGWGHNVKDDADTVWSRFNAIQCPEMQWNEPTLREVLTDLMMVDDCIPIVRNGVIDFIDISDIGDEITEEQKKGINYIVESQSSQDYVSELKMRLVNVANNSLPSGNYEDVDSANLPNDKTKVVEDIGFRNDEAYLLTTENMEVETSYPIWKLFFAEARAYASCKFRVYDTETLYHDVVYGDTFSVVLKSSSKNFVLEYGEWQTKDIYYGGFGDTQPLSSDYQNTCLYYQRGAKGIHNFNAKQEKTRLWISSQVSVYELIFKSSEIKDFLWEKANKDYPNKVAYIPGEDPSVDFKKVKFRVAYEPVDECVFLASKTPLAKNKRQVVDNQTNSYVDIRRQGMLEYLKANRLGNKIKVINARYKCDEAQMPSLSQKVNGSIIFKREISVYGNYISANFYATDNYVLKDYFTSVKSKIRSWRVVSGSEAFVRADILKFYVGKNVQSISNEDMIVPSYQTVEQYLNNFNYCSIYFNTKNSGQRPAYHGHGEISYNGLYRFANNFIVEFTKHRCGNSVLFTVRMKDNSIVGKYVYNKDETGGMGQKDATYTDQDGENIGGVIYFSSSFNPVINENVGEDISSYLKPGIANSQMTNVIAKIPFSFKKDNKEITQITIQFEISDEANDMFIGKI